MLERLLLAILTQLGSYLIAEVMKSRAKKTVEAVTEGEIDKRLAVLKSAALETLDGKPATKEQREKFKNAVADFVRNTSGGL